MLALIGCLCSWLLVSRLEATLVAFGARLEMLA